MPRRPRRVRPYNPRGEQRVPKLSAAGLRAALRDINDRIDRNALRYVNTLPYMNRERANATKFMQRIRENAAQRLQNIESKLSRKAEAYKKALGSAGG